MTAEADIAAIDDGGENTAAEVRTALTSVLNAIPASPGFIGKSYTLSPSPHATYADNEVVVSTDGTPAWTAGFMLTDGIIGDPSVFTSSYVGFNIGTGTVAVRVDAGAAIGGNILQVFGMYGSDSIGRPTALHLEHSDNDSSWTTVENRTGLTGSDSGGRQLWKASFDTSAAGSHQYWRVTITGYSGWTFLTEIELV